MHHHQRGIDLLLDVTDAAENLDSLSHEEIRQLLIEVAEVMRQVLDRDARADYGEGREQD